MINTRSMFVLCVHTRVCLGINSKPHIILFCIISSSRLPSRPVQVDTEGEMFGMTAAGLSPAPLQIRRVIISDQIPCLCLSTYYLAVRNRIIRPIVVQKQMGSCCKMKLTLAAKDFLKN